MLASVPQGPTTERHHFQLAAQDLPSHNLTMLHEVTGVLRGSMRNDDMQCRNTFDAQSRNRRQTMCRTAESCSMSLW